MWPADNIKKSRVDDLVPYARNARTHSDAQVAQIAASIKEWGWTTPVLLDENNGIIAGHGRVLAARKLGISEIPTMIATGWSEAQKRAYILADNQLALNAGWDTDLLKVELSELEALDFDVDLIGFDGDFLANMLNEPTEGLTDPDQVPEAPEDPVTVEGDVWLLGNHRLLCGDSTNPQHVERLMDGKKADFVYMDPPYGMKLDTDYAKTAKVKGKSYKPVHGDFDDFDPSWHLAFFSSAREQFWWGADYYCQTLPKDGSWVVWDKKKEDLDESIGSGFELCWSINSHKRQIARFLWSGFTAKESNEQRKHPTQKPVALAEWFFDRWGAKGDIVVDLYGGSGTTLIACEKTNRHCRMMELDPAYCDVIVKRWEDFTGQDAIHEASGKTFYEMTNNKGIDHGQAA